MQCIRLIDDNPIYQSKSITCNLSYILPVIPQVASRIFFVQYKLIAWRMATCHGDFSATVGHWLDERSDTTNAEVLETLDIQNFEEPITFRLSENIIFICKWKNATFKLYLYLITF